MGREIGLAFVIFFPFLAGLSVYGAGRLKRGDGGEGLLNLLAIGLTAVEFAVVAALTLSVLTGGADADQRMVLEIPEVCGMGLGFELDGFRALYGCVTAFMWMMVTILSREYFAGHANTNRFRLFLFWTLGAVMGVFLSADLYTTFIFFEIMSFTSYVWVAQEENRTALRAADTYLAVAVLGGLVLLMGLFLLYHELGTLTVRELSAAAAKCDDRRMLYAAGSCMLVGFGAKAGAFPLHIWLPKAHPVAPAPASALLSGVLTKTGIYGILILSTRLFFQDGAWGGLILLIGLLTMPGGALLAVFSVDLKRTLACSSMSQIGFILVGIGVLALPEQGSLLTAEEASAAVFAAHSELAAHGVVLHMVNHSLIKLVLFMAAGVIFMNTHALNLNDIQGFGRKKPLLKAIFLTGALAVSGIPFFCGYISKTLLHESILEYGGEEIMKAAEIIFLLSGGLTLAYMTKLFVAIFIERNADALLQEKYDGMKAYMNPGTAFALTGSALLLLIWGLFPHGIMERAAAAAQGFLGMAGTGGFAEYFSPACLRGGMISIGAGIFIYLIFVRKCLMGKGKYRDVWPGWLDLEEILYRPLLLRILPVVAGVLCRLLDSFADTVVVLLRRTLYRDSRLPRERTEGNLFTELLGGTLNAFQSMANHTWRRENPVHRDYVHLAAVKSEEIRETNHIIHRSLSFGLLLVCIGLALILFYIIWFS